MTTQKLKKNDLKFKNVAVLKVCKIINIMFCCGNAQQGQLAGILSNKAALT